ncbi:MAG: BrnT family toxin [Puniceicoccaceae bacterium]|nr:MAG: BrnT family toxin [Puniceicoccaceae bacterium]
MEFEFDPDKSVSNKEKHGIDFVEIQKLWSDPRHLNVPAGSTTEVRRALIGELDGRIWVCVFTPRGENLRIISARTARNEEREGYYHS